MIMQFLSFSLLMWYITRIVLQILKNPCISGTNPTWSWWMILLMYHWIWFLSILLRILHLCLSVIFSCNFLFLWYLWFWYQRDSGFIKWFLQCFFLCSFLEAFRRISVKWKWMLFSHDRLFVTPWIHGVFQAGTLEWVTFPFSRGSSQQRDWSQVSCIAGGFFTNWATREALL